MIKRIDLFVPPRSQYGVLQHFTKKLAEALSEAGVACRVLEAQRNNPKPFLDQIFSNPPDCTLSFNGLLPDDEGRFFCDMIKIPHVCVLVDSPNEFLSLAKSPNSIITCPDRFACDLFRGLGANNVLFFPHCTEAALKTPIDNPRRFDVVMLATCIDYERMRKEWREVFHPTLSKAMDSAIDIVLSDQETSYVQAFVQGLDQELRNSKSDLDPATVDFVTVLNLLEDYIKGQDRIELLRSIKDAKVDLFGSGENGLWQKYFGSHSKNIIIHDPVPYEQALSIMKETKIILNSHSAFKNGAHERIFVGPTCGAMVLANENIYLREQFIDKENIVFYKPKQWEFVNEDINEYLSDDVKRLKLVQKSQDLILAQHTWKQRVESLIEGLDPILKNLSNSSVAK